MKRILSIFLACVATSAFSATLNPVQLLNPAGSSAGQAIISTGPSTAPTWGGFSATALTGIVPIANGGTGASSAAAALSNLGGLSTATAASTYLTQSNAASTYLTQTSAASTYGAKTSPLSQFAATTSAQLAGVISDETGTGSLVLATGPTINQPNIVGVTNGTAAAAGSVGERPAATNLSGVSLVNATVSNASSVNLTAGDYDVSCTAIFSPAATTVPSAAIVGISTSSAAAPGAASGQETLLQVAFSTGGQIALPSPIVPISVSVATPVYCVAQLNFTTSTATVAGIMRVRRLR